MTAAELRALAEKAIGGTWELTGVREHGIKSGSPTDFSIGFHAWDHNTTRENARFIVALANNRALLIAALELAEAVDRRDGESRSDDNGLASVASVEDFLSALAAYRAAKETR